MIWSDVIGQKRVQETLKRIASGDRVAHAWMFHGPAGVGKMAAALAFSQQLLCETQTGCGVCSACSRSKRLIHPDLHVFFAQPNDTPVEELLARRQMLAEDVYAEVDFSRRPMTTGTKGKPSTKQSMYNVKQIRDDVNHQMRYQPAEGRYKIAIMAGVERMRTEAANAFLKNLEEPGPRTVFILLTDRLDQILPTIASRCQPLHFGPISAGEIEKVLESKYEIPSTEARLLSHMADGSFTRALSLRGDQSLLELRQLVVEFFRKSWAINTRQLFDLVEIIGRMGRDEVRQFLYLMITWVRDLMLYQTIGENAQLVNEDQKQIIAKFCQNIPNINHEAIVDAIEESLMLVRRNVRINLTMLSLAREVHAAMKSIPPAGVYIPLDAQI